MAGQNHKGKKMRILFPSSVTPSTASAPMILSRHDSVHDYQFAARDEKPLKRLDLRGSH